MPLYHDIFARFMQSAFAQAIKSGMFFGVLVFGFFAFVERLLTDAYKYKVAVWLVGVEVGKNVEPWPSTFAKVFDRVFGEQHLSLKCFSRSCLATMISCFLCRSYFYTFDNVLSKPELNAIVLAPTLLFVFDYFSLLETRFVMSLILRWQSTTKIVTLMIADLLITGATGFLPTYYFLHGLDLNGQSIGRFLIELQSDEQYDMVSLVEANRSAEKWSRALGSTIRALKQRIDPIKIEVVDRNKTLDPKVVESLEAELHRTEEEYYKLSTLTSGLQKRIEMHKARTVGIILWLPTFFTSIWLWLYAASGFIVKTAYRFDSVVNWFNKSGLDIKIDIEKKPLTLMGIVAGSLVAVIYWSFALLG